MTVSTTPPAPTIPDDVAELVKKYSTIGKVVKANDAEALDKMLSWFRGDEVHSQQRIDDKTMGELLWNAASISNEATFEVLVKHGADPLYAQYDPRGPKPGDRRAQAFLQKVSDRALASGNVPIVQWMIDHKHLAVDTTLDNGNSLLQVVLKENQFEMAQWLLDRGADINNRNLYGKTALHHAAEEANLFSVVFLMQRGVDVAVEDLDGTLAAEMIPEDDVNLFQPKHGKFHTTDLFDMLEACRHAKAADANVDFRLPADLIDGVEASYKEEFKKDFPAPPVKRAAFRA